MRLLFLCSGLQRGKDGVGDYARLLAGECARQGHSCALLGLHDRHATTPQREEDAVPSLTLPAIMPWAERFRHALAFRNEFRPDWMSLQFVPYGLQDKGIVSSWTSRLRELTAGTTRRHVMFHELWIGAAQQAPLRERVIGALQRWCIQRLVAQLEPEVVHTHTPAYVVMLEEIGCTGKLLPLFGNIPPMEQKSAEVWRTLAAVKCPMTEANRPTFLLAGFFGTLHPQWEPEPLFHKLRAGAQQAGKRVALLAIGRLGGAGENRWTALKDKYGETFLFVHLGEQSAATISQVLRELDVGIATSPLQLFSKSGTAAAMLDHGLPVIANRDDWHLRTFVPIPGLSEPLLHLDDDRLEAKLASGLPRLPAEDRLTSVATQFLRDLN